MSTELADPRLSPWQTFFFIVGSSGAALIGVQFVVITLIATIRRRADAATISAFATPPAGPRRSSRRRLREAAARERGSGRLAAALSGKSGP